MDSHNDKLFLLRGSIALNNLGVALMQQHRFHEAMDTLRDSMVAIQSCMPGNETPASKFATIEDCLRKANQRSSSTSHVPSLIHRGQEIFVSSTEDADIFSVLHRGHLDKFYTESAQFSPIRIRESLLESTDLDFSSAIILYNMGLSHLALSRTVSTEADAYLCQTTSLKMLRMSYSIVYNHFAASSDDDDADNENRVLLMAIVLRKIVAALKDMHLYQQADEALNALTTLDDAMKQMSCFELFEEEHVPCPAAAA